ncbi:MAG: short-chain dehydrogenase [Lysobacterales bacterium]|nr:MAG: short-chain dehydrogenase [Xanthomonadales bacterium]
MRVLVTGANRGLGLEFCRQYLSRGAEVLAACRKPASAAALCELLALHPGRLRVLPLELTDERSIVELARELDRNGDALDRLINNAGVLVSGERFGAVSAEALVQSFRVNAAGPFLLAQALAGALARGVRPRAVSISSSLGSIAATQRFGTPSYAISKAALNMATRQLALALEPRGVLCFALSPGWVRTDMGGPEAELGVDESVGAMIDFLERAGPEAAGGFFDRHGSPLAW